MTNKNNHGIVNLTKDRGFITLKNRAGKLRRQLGLSQYWLGDKSGVTTITTNMIETENILLTLIIANDIANDLDSCIKYLT